MGPLSQSDGHDFPRLIDQAVPSLARAARTSPTSSPSCTACRNPIERECRPSGRGVDERALPACKSLTWDRAKELADHKRFTVATDIDVYFCDLHSPWQHGSNENTNRLLRQYFP